MQTDQIRETFLSFFEGKSHLRLPSFSLIPNNDPSLLLIGAGMAPFKPYFTGMKVPPRSRVTTAQKCLRTPDIERVGKTARHATFFEMLGNFSFGDYFKENAIIWAWELVTQGFKLNPERLWVTVYREDEEAAEIWMRETGVPSERIVRLGKEDNFWEIGPGPCGPCSEIFYDLGPEKGCGRPECSVGCDCDRYMEIWNLVFTQYEKTDAGEYLPLKQKNIDTGAGLERLAIVMQGVNNLYETDKVRPLLDYYGQVLHKEYGKNSEIDMSLRIITEHSRGITFLISDGVLPGNEGRGYVLRRLLRRAYRHAWLLGRDEPFLYDGVNRVVELMSDAYPELNKRRDYISQVVKLEEERFKGTLAQGMEILERQLEKLIKSGEKILPGDEAFRLYDTYGFPLDLTREILEERGFILEQKKFEHALEEQRERARAARNERVNTVDMLAPFRDIDGEFVGYGLTSCSARVERILDANGRIVSQAGKGKEVYIALNRTPFYPEQGGQVGDTGIIQAPEVTVKVKDTILGPGGLPIHKGIVEDGILAEGAEIEAAIDKSRRMKIACNHTATHLLHKALRDRLGDHVAQAGSLVTADRLRFDYTHFEAPSHEVLQQVEMDLNRHIWENIPVEVEETTVEEARRQGAMALFEAKYGDKVRLVKIGGYSFELCGGTHARFSGQIGLLKIISESGIGAGVRRIEAVTAESAFLYLRENESLVKKIAKSLKAEEDCLLEKVKFIQQQEKDLMQKIKELENQLASGFVGDLINNCKEINGIKIVASKVDAAGIDGLRNLADRLRDNSGEAVVVLGTVAENKVLLLAAATPGAVEAGVHAGKLIKQVASITGGGGGGRPEMAQAGGKNPQQLDQALSAVITLVQDQLAEK